MTYISCSSDFSSFIFCSEKHFNFIGKAQFRPATLSSDSFYLCYAVLEKNVMKPFRIHDSSTIVHVGIKFQPSRPHSSWEKWQNLFNVWKLERKKRRNKGMNKHQQPDSTCVPSFNLLGLAVPEKSVTKILMFENCRKKNEKVKGQISSSSLIPVYTIYMPTVHVCTKFQSSTSHSSWEKCDKKF